MDEIASALISLQELDQILSKQKIRFVKISRVIEQDGGLVKLQSDYDKIKRDNLQFQLNVSKIDSEILEIQKNRLNYKKSFMVVLLLICES